jgi:methionyl-tRNA formyltransferase
MRIIIVGQGPFGEKTLEALIQKGEEMVGVFSPSDKRGEAMGGLAQKSGISSFRPAIMKIPEVREAYGRLKPDLAILAFVTDIIPQSLLAIPSIGTLCYHPSLLPRHRGASAINWAIIQGDTRTGLTIFWADKGIDTGPILLQKEVEIGPEETTGSLYFNKLFSMGIGAIVEAVDLIKKGKAPRIPQDESQATYEPPCDDRVASIDFSKPIDEVYNLIRGCDPQPGAYSAVKGKRIRFYDARKRSLAAGEGAGEVVAIGKEGLEIALQGGIIVVGKLKVDKGEKVGPIEFAQSAGLKVGNRLGE